jgi:CRP-like cAMP-binding protein
MARSPASRQPELPEPEEASVSDIPVGNRLLAALPADEYALLAPHLEGFETPHQYLFYEPDKPISHVYFPVSGVGSLLMLAKGGAAVEVATAGNEGMVGIPVFLEQESTPGRALMQVPGAVVSMPVEDFRREVVDVPGSYLQLLLQHYTHALTIQMAQGMACNRLHNVERRAARWLLMCRDRVGGPTYPLTQEFLAQMLGVRRAGVSEVASALQEQGLITYTRGVITILDPAGLERRACECYRIIRDVFDRMLANL